METRVTINKPMLVSFSGLDGSGKSTQIEQLRLALHNAGLSTRLLAFWDDVVVAVKYREGFVHKVYKSERGIGTPEKPVNRRDKNMRGWHLTMARHLLYLADALNLRRLIGRQRALAMNNDNGERAPDVIILDRYIYDELANLNVDNPLSRSFVRMVGRLVPQPDIALLLDADPVVAQARKPEYPVEFMRHCRQSYFNLAVTLGNITVVPPLALTDATQAILRIAEQRLAARGKTVELIRPSVRAA